MFTGDLNCARLRSPIGHGLDTLAVIRPMPTRYVTETLLLIHLRRWLAIV